MIPISNAYMHAYTYFRAYVASHMFLADQQNYMQHVILLEYLVCMAIISAIRHGYIVTYLHTIYIEAIVILYGYEVAN